MPHGRRHDKPAGTTRRVHDRGGAAGRLWVALVLDRATNIDEVVGKHPKSDPAFDANIASISAAVETMPPLGDADAPLAAGAPFLAVSEPTLLLLAFAFGALLQLDHLAELGGLGGLALADDFR